MKRALVVVLLLAGCAQEPAPLPPANHKTTVLRFTSAPAVCPEPELPKAALKRVTKSRDDWKRYAESLELLMPKDADRAPHP